MMQIIGNITGYALVSLAAIFSERVARHRRGGGRRARHDALGRAPGRQGPAREATRGQVVADDRREAWATDILRQRSYIWLVASRLFFLMAGGILFAYVIAFLKYTLRRTRVRRRAASTSRCSSWSPGQRVAVVPAARLSDRIGRKPMIYARALIGADRRGRSPPSRRTSRGAIVGAGLFGMAAAARSSRSTGRS